MAKLVNDGGKSDLDLYHTEKRQVAQEFANSVAHGAIVLSDQGNYWRYDSGFFYGWWDKLTPLQVWWYKLIGKIK